MAALVAAALAAAAPEGEPPAEAACGPRLEGEILAALGARQFLDAHVLARTAVALCPPSPATARHRTYDALALLELDDSARARELLRLAGADPAARPRAEVLTAWSYLRDRDATAFRLALRPLPAEAQARLLLLEGAGTSPGRLHLPQAIDPAVRARLLEIAQAERTRRPWLAATLSVVLPGAGQAYAGSWQAAAVAFLLNAALITATAQLVHERLYFAAGAAGVAASFFYVGNVINAADLARRRNETAAAPLRRDLERRLVPEAHPYQ
jgi:hypothetical protein